MAVFHFLRPLRVALSIGIGPYLDSFIVSIQRRLGVSKKLATVVTVILVNIVGSFAYMALCLKLAAIASGVRTVGFYTFMRPVVEAFQAIPNALISLGR